MRGSTTFQSLFADTLPLLTKQEGKGRSIDLNARRDELLIYRYFFYGNFTPYRYERILKSLNEEFFLSERRIQDIIATHSVLMRQLRNAPPSLGQYKEMYPHLIWRPVTVPVAVKSPIQL